MSAILWHSGTRIRDQPRLSARTMRSGGHPGLYLSGGSSSIPDETSSGFCSSGQKVMFLGGNAVEMTWTGCFPVLSHSLSGWSYASSLEAEIFCCFLLVARASRDVGLGAMAWAGLCRARLGVLLLLALGCALRAARSLRVDGVASPIRAVSFVRVPHHEIKSQWRGGLFHPCLVLLGG
jgi:hypothetical protein